MLRINLLPPYIYEGSKRRNVTILWVVLLLVVAGGFVFAKMSLDKQAADIKAEELAKADEANRADQAKTDAEAIRTQSQEIRGKADFVKGAVEYNAQTYPPVFANIVTYTTRKVLYDGATPAGNAVTLPAYAPSLADVGHYVMAMERNPNISNVSIAINSIPGFPTSGYAGQSGGQATGERPGAGGHNFTATLTLLKPISGGPAYPAGGGGGPAGGGGGGMSIPMGPPGPGGMSMSGPMGPMGPGAMSGPPGAPMAAGAAAPGAGAMSGRN